MVTSKPCPEPVHLILRRVLVSLILVTVVPPVLHLRLVHLPLHFQQLLRLPREVVLQGRDLVAPGPDFWRAHLLHFLPVLPVDDGVDFVGARVVVEAQILGLKTGGAHRRGSVPNREGPSDILSE